MTTFAVLPTKELQEALLKGNPQPLLTTLTKLSSVELKICGAVPILATLLVMNEASLPTQKTIMALLSKASLQPQQCMLVYAPVQKAIKVHGAAAVGGIDILLRASILCHSVMSVPDIATLKGCLDTLALGDSRHLLGDLCRALGDVGLSQSVRELWWKALYLGIAHGLLPSDVEAVQNLVQVALTSADAAEIHSAAATLCSAYSVQTLQVTRPHLSALCTAARVYRDDGGIESVVQALEYAALTSYVPSNDIPTTVATLRYVCDADATSTLQAAANAIFAWLRYPAATDGLFECIAVLLRRGDEAVYGTLSQRIARGPAQAEALAPYVHPIAVIVCGKASHLGLYHAALPALDAILSRYVIDAHHRELVITTTARVAETTARLHRLTNPSAPSIWTEDAIRRLSLWVGTAGTAFELQTVSATLVKILRDHPGLYDKVSLETLVCLPLSRDVFEGLCETYRRVRAHWFPEKATVDLLSRLVGRAQGPMSEKNFGSYSASDRARAVCIALVLQVIIPVHVEGAPVVQWEVLSSVFEFVSTSNPKEFYVML